MPRVGASKFDKILKESGGYIVDDGYIKYIVASPLPDGLAHLIYLNEVQMQFAEIDKKLSTRLHIILYELTAYKGYMTKNMKYIHFNGKVYEVVNKKGIKRVNQYSCYHIVLDEVK